MQPDCKGSPDRITDAGLVDYKTCSEVDARAALIADLERNGYSVVGEESGVILVKANESLGVVEPPMRNVRPVTGPTRFAAMLALMGATGLDLATAFDRCNPHKRGGFVNCPDCGNPYNPAKGPKCYKCQRRDNG